MQSRDSKTYSPGRKRASFVRDVYKLTRGRAFAHDLPLRTQLRKCAVSIPSNIAEGFERWSRAELKRFLLIARGSCAELRTQIYIATDIGYIADATGTATREQAEEVSRLIGLFHASLRRKK